MRKLILMWLCWQMRLSNGLLRSLLSLVEITNNLTSALIAFHWTNDWYFLNQLLSTFYPWILQIKRTVTSCPSPHVRFPLQFESIKTGFRIIYATVRLITNECASPCRGIPSWWGRAPLWIHIRHHHAIDPALGVCISWSGGAHSLYSIRSRTPYQTTSLYKTWGLLAK